MSFCFNGIRTSRLVCAFAACLAVFVGTSSSTFAQPGGGGGFNNFNNFQNTIGGIQIDAHGVIRHQSNTLNAEIRAKLLKQMKGDVAGDIKTTTKLRMVSLKALEKAVRDAIDNGKALSEEIEFMAGLQRIEYVFMVPEKNDIVIAGPAEGWKLDDQGNVVGVTTGCPVIRLEDFLNALRSVENARVDRGISVSIDPTDEGIRSVKKLFSQIGSNFSPQRAAQVEQAMGPQTISLTGIPTNSRMAQILVAADYRMKRLSMGFEEAPVKGMPSFLELCKKKGLSPKVMSPRFWMECNYKPLARSEDGMAWQLRGSGVKTLTEDSFVSASGKVKKSGKSGRLAQKWADSMTEKFEELATEDPVFRELRNVMDMAVVSALIAKENMLERVELELPMILGQTGNVKTQSRNVPKQVPSQCSFIKLNRSWLVTASGGVQVDSWSVVDKDEVVALVGKVRSDALGNDTGKWYWNAP